MRAGSLQIGMKNGPVRDRAGVEMMSPRAISCGGDALFKECTKAEEEQVCPVQVRRVVGTLTVEAYFLATLNHALCQPLAGLGIAGNAGAREAHGAAPVGHERFE